MSVADWIAVALVVLPLFGKCCLDWQANALAKHHNAWARVMGMAGRQAAGIARTLSVLPANVDSRAVEATLIQSATGTILNELPGDTKIAKATSDNLALVVQGELAKLVVPTLPLPTIADVLSGASPAALAKAP